MLVPRHSHFKTTPCFYLQKRGGSFGIVLKMLYCKFDNFCENFIFANSVKTHICDVENS